MKVILMRGLPGSGKSTWIKKNAPTAWVISADAFLMENGVYNWTLPRLAEAHQKCMAAFVVALKNNTPVTVLDNTNLRARDLRYYVEMAEQYGAEIEIRTILADSEECFRRQTHNVPASTFTKLIERFSNPLPPEWQKYEVRSGSAEEV